MEKLMEAVRRAEELGEHARTSPDFPLFSGHEKSERKLTLGRELSWKRRQGPASEHICLIQTAIRAKQDRQVDVTLHIPDSAQGADTVHYHFPGNLGETREHRQQPTLSVAASTRPLRESESVVLPDPRTAFEALERAGYRMGTLIRIEGIGHGVFVRNGRDTVGEIHFYDVEKLKAGINPGFSIVAHAGHLRRILLALFGNESGPNRPALIG